jgi:uncharacterized protein YndB with AHSA1/START domain
MNNDSIEREITIAAPIDKVWSVLTEPDHIGAWFGTGTPVQIDLQPGGVMELDHGEHGAYSTTIVKVDPPHTFSYRWASAYPGVPATEDNSTLVEFTLEETADGTLLRVVESGFASIVIPAARASSAGYESHAQGWSGVIEKIAHYLDGSDVGPLLPVA